MMGCRVLASGHMLGQDLSNTDLKAMGAEIRGVVLGKMQDDLSILYSF